MLSLGAAPTLDHLQGRRRTSTRERIASLLPKIDAAAGAPTWTVRVHHKNGSDTRVFHDNSELESFVMGVLNARRFTSFSVTRD